MSLFKRWQRRVVAVFASLMLIFQSLAGPAAFLASNAYAQDASPSEQSSPEPSPQETSQASPIPDESPSPTPAVSPSPNDQLTLGEQLSSAPTPQTSDQNVSNSNDGDINPSTDSTGSGQAGSEQSPPPKVEGQSSVANGHLEVNVIGENTNNTNSSSLALNFSEPTESVSSATVTTDKSDYAPTEAAVISGSNFSANTTYTLVITSSDPPAVDFLTDVTTSDQGTFTYTYQLDGTYRPNYKVELKDSEGNVVATTTFTDAATGTLFPNGQGFYTAWTGDENDINETGSANCGSGDGNENIATTTSDARESVLISLSNIPDGSTITSVDVNVTYRNGNDAGADDGTFTTLSRLNGTDLDSGVNFVATNTTCTSGTQTINVADTVKNGATTLEVGVRKTSTDTSEVWVGTIRAVVTYTEAPQPDLTATKTNNLGGGNATVNQAFTWTIRVRNSGAATATFTNNQDILRDERPSTGVSSYGSPAITTSGITGNVDCTQSGSSNRDLTCEADGTVTFPPGSYIDVSFTVNPNATGVLSNPRSGQSCEADDNNIVAESNESNNDCTNSVTVNAADTTLPTDPTDVASTSHDVDVSSEDNTIDMTWTVAGSAPGATDAGSGIDGYSYEFSNSASTIPDTTKDAEESATGTTSTALVDGSWYFHLRTRDNADNWTSTVHVGPYIIDTTDPETTIDSGPSGLVSVNDATFEFNSNEEATFECQLDGGGFSACTSPQAYNDLIDGEHTFNVQAKDSAGNTDPTPASQSWIVDATAPTLAEVTSVPTPDNNSSPSYTFNSTEAGAITYGGDCSSSATAAAIIGDNTIAFDSLLDGLYNNCTIVVTDDAGNASDTLNVSAFTIDTVAPVSTIDSPDNDTFHKDPIVISGNSSDTNSDTVSYTSLFYKTSDCNEEEDDCWTEIDTNSEAEGIQSLTNSSLDEPFSWGFDWTPAEDGTYDIKAEATDDADNSETSPVVTNITYDTTAPATPTADPAAGDYTSDQSVTLFSDDSLSGVDNIFYTTDGTDPSDTNGTLYGDPIDIGVDTTIKAIAYDNAGNSSDILTVEYGIAPIISGETSGSVTETSVTITWDTDDPATSRVVYDTVSHTVLGDAPNYDYANSTVEADNSPKVTSHSVTISGLTAGTTYFYRTVSHGSPEAVGSEKSVATAQVASTSNSTSTSTSTSTNAVQSPSPSPAVLGARKASLASETVPEEGGQVAGETTKDVQPNQSAQVESGQSSILNYRNLAMILVGLGILGLLIFLMTRRRANI